MPKEPIDGPEPTFSEDDIQRAAWPARRAGVEDPAKMTPQREKRDLGTERPPFRPRLGFLASGGGWDRRTQARM